MVYLLPLGTAKVSLLYWRLETARVSRSRYVISFFPRSVRFSTSINKTYHKSKIKKNKYDECVTSAIMCRSVYSQPCAERLCLEVLSFSSSPCGLGLRAYSRTILIETSYESIAGREVYSVISFKVCSIILRWGRARLVFLGTRYGAMVMFRYVNVAEKTMSQL